jgi:hypothetical protein
MQPSRLKPKAVYRDLGVVRIHMARELMIIRYVER